VLWHPTLQYSQCTVDVDLTHQAVATKLLLGTVQTIKKSPATAQFYWLFSESETCNPSDPHVQGS